MPKPMLVISYAYPPLAAPEAYLVAKTLASLKPLEIDVLYAAPETKVLPEDKSLLPYVQKHTRASYPVGFGKEVQFLSQFSSVKKGLFSLSVFPDRARLLNSEAFRKAQSLGIQKYSCLLTWSQFHSSHLVGAKLKTLYPKLPWLAHFSDPWADNPFLPYPQLMKPIQRYLEKKVMLHADAILFTSTRTLDLVTRSYPTSVRQKSYVVPHAFDEALYSKAPRPANEKILVRYLGKFYGPRNPLSFLKALDFLIDESPESLEKARFEFYGCGNGFPGEKELFSERYRKFIQVFPSCSYLKSLELMQEADINLVIDAPFDNTVFLPSKLVDALGARSRLFGITPEGTSKEVILRSGGLVASPTNPEEIARLFKETLVMKPSVVQFEKEREQYSLDSIGHQMKGCLKDLGVSV